jgi:hypothetical protein
MRLFRRKQSPPPLPYEEINNGRPCCPHRIYHNDVNAAYMEFRTSTDLNGCKKVSFTDSGITYSGNVGTMCSRFESSFTAVLSGKG